MVAKRKLCKACVCCSASSGALLTVKDVVLLLRA